MPRLIRCPKCRENWSLDTPGDAWCAKCGIITLTPKEADTK